MTITEATLNSVRHKNARARKRMARRCMRKAFAFNVKEIGIIAALNKRFTPPEMEIGRLAALRRQPAKREAMMLAINWATNE